MLNTFLLCAVTLFREDPMKLFTLIILMAITFFSHAEVRFDAGNNLSLEMQGNELSKILGSLKESGYFNGKIDLQRDELLNLLNEESGLITSEGKRYLIIDPDMIERIQFVESSDYVDDSKF